MNPRRLQPKTDSILFKKSKLVSQPVSQIVKKQFYLLVDHDKKINNAVTKLSEKLDHLLPKKVDRSTLLQSLIDTVSLDSDSFVEELAKTIKTKIIAQLQDEESIPVSKSDQ